MIWLSPVAMAAELIAGQAELSADEITVVDRLTLTVRLDTDPSAAVEPWLEEAITRLTDAGWTVISVAAEPPALSEGGRVEHVTRFVLEPFLEGEYAVPRFDCAALGPDRRRHAVVLGGLRVRVRSLLPADEPDQFPLEGSATDGADPAGGDKPLGVLRAVPGPAASGSKAGVIVVIVLLVVVIGLIVLRHSARRFMTGPGFDPVGELERTARAVRSVDDLAPLDRALRDLLGEISVSDNGQLHRGLELLAELEQARYSPARSGVDARGIAERAVSMARAVRMTERGGEL